MRFGCAVRSALVEKDEFDAFGKLPAGLLDLTLVSPGSYRECIELVAPYDVHYCYATATAVKQNNTAVGVNLGLKIAVCMPKSCNEEDIPKVLDSPKLGGLVPMTFTSSSCVPTYVKPTTAFWIFMGFMAFFVSWAALATAIDFITDVYDMKVDRESNYMRMLFVFSVYSNGAAILETSPHKEGNLKSLASIRFISMTWVVAGHTIGQNAIAADSLGPVLTLWNPLLSTTITNAFFSVDTFFLLSGILVSYLFFKKPSRRMLKSPFTWIMFYVHRYIRLTPPIMIFVGFYTVTLPFVNGPWTAATGGIAGNQVATCQKYWWRNALYINNFFDMSAECYPITWYLAVDTQMYITAPIFLVALALFPILGAILLILCGAASIAYVYVITFRDDLPATVVGALAFPKTASFFSEYYEKPWTRCIPYLIGIGVGYLLATAKKPKIHLLTALFLWTIAVGVALLCLYGPHNYIEGVDDWSELLRASYNNFSKVGWSLAVSWVIVANHYGWGGPVATFMDHPLWKPLGRLSYCGYIVHYFVIQYVFNLDDRPAHYVSIWEAYVYRVIPVVVLSYIFAFFWSCLFESSIIKLEKVLLSKAVLSKNGKSKEPIVDEKKNGPSYTYRPQPFDIESIRL
ncbi:unnamed protein product [Cylicocyclus nassatus]|uniref:Nose resistant-to-fluoxetine protein N-terminal domain-containing protein n=1 Tax=Cylicocyclus nassatus TaxID=53992 RepID=A0AA36DPH3_CYLNA|nr:unnamed protein product [Cylicocyclus nassatus]